MRASHILLKSLVVATVSLFPIPLLGAVTPLSSESFDHKFEMNNVGEGLDPAASTAQWSRGVGGSVSASLSEGNLVYNTTSDASAGLYYEAASSTWSSLSNPAIGWTFEVRLRVDSSVDNGALVYQPPNGATQTTINDRAFELVVGDGSTTSYLRIGLNSLSTISFGGTLISADANNDTYHTFRIAKEGGASGYLVWRDGVAMQELGSSVFETGFQQDVLYFVDGTGSFGGSGLVDYVRFDSDGAFAPAPVPEPASLGMWAVLSCGLLRRGLRAPNLRS